MRIIICCDGRSAEDQVSSFFGRCAYLQLIDTQSNESESFANPHLDAQSGVGVKVAQWAVDQGADALIANQVGPKAASVLEAAGISVHRFFNLSAAAARARLLSETLS